MHLLEVQVKYGLNVVDPADELQDFNVDTTIKMQSQLENCMQLMVQHNKLMPDCIKELQTHTLIVDKEKLNCLTEKVNELQ